MLLQKHTHAALYRYIWCAAVYTVQWTMPPMLWKKSHCLSFEGDLLNESRVQVRYSLELNDSIFGEIYYVLNSSLTNWAKLVS